MTGLAIAVCAGIALRHARETWRERVTLVDVAQAALVFGLALWAFAGSITVELVAK
jgi:hypothetical protein